jgi:hypothetical protein
VVGIPVVLLGTRSWPNVLLEYYYYSLYKALWLDHSEYLRHLECNSIQSFPSSLKWQWKFDNWQDQMFGQGLLLITHLRIFWSQNLNLSIIMNTQGLAKDFSWEVSVCGMTTIICIGTLYRYCNCKLGVSNVGLDLLIYSDSYQLRRFYDCSYWNFIWISFTRELWTIGATLLHATMSKFIYSSSSKFKFWVSYTSGQGLVSIFWRNLEISEISLKFQNVSGIKHRMWMECWN